MLPSSCLEISIRNLMTVKISKFLFVCSVSSLAHFDIVLVLQSHSCFRLSGDTELRMAVPHCHSLWLLHSPTSNGVLTFQSKIGPNSHFSIQNKSNFSLTLLCRLNKPQSPALKAKRISFSKWGTSQTSLLFCLVTQAWSDWFVGCKLLVLYENQLYWSQEFLISEQPWTCLLPSIPHWNWHPDNWPLTPASSRLQIPTKQCKV